MLDKQYCLFLFIWNILILEFTAYFQLVTLQRLNVSNYISSFSLLFFWYIQILQNFFFQFLVPISAVRIGSLKIYDFNTLLSFISNNSIYVFSSFSSAHNNQPLVEQWYGGPRGRHRDVDMQRYWNPPPQCHVVPTVSKQWLFNNGK